MKFDNKTKKSEVCGFQGLGDGDRGGRGSECQKVTPHMYIISHYIHHRIISYLYIFNHTREYQNERVTYFFISLSFCVY